jgi:hypothetical protein
MSDLSLDLPPEPFHRWARNEVLDNPPPPAYDRCLTCGVARYPHTDAAQAIASGPCPGSRDWITAVHGGTPRKTRQ